MINLRFAAFGRALAVAALVCLTSFVAPVQAHPLSPSLLEIKVGKDDSLDVLWKMPLRGIPGLRLLPQFPPHCRSNARPELTEGRDHLTSRLMLECGEGSFIGSTISVAGLESAPTEVLLRIILADGSMITKVLRGDAPSFKIPSEQGPLAVARDYAAMGFEHIAGGMDHLLFVFGLCLLVSGFRSLAGTVTAFTLGHSITLSIAALDIVRLPSAPVEVAIAASVLALAVELARNPTSPTLLRRRPWLAAAGFGLLHGLGFAGALREVGLPQVEIPLALASFNVGIEVGQLGFVVLVVAVRAVAVRVFADLPDQFRLVPIYGMGSLAAMWMFERIF
ncbi:MAG: hydrogenase/urease accessory protein HupE [Hyphomicrobiaceae bacterium]|jgi:hydrogenase/urease accessory protein HupE